MKIANRIRIKFVKEDLWIGAYYNHERIYICLIPTLPIIIFRKKSDICKLCNQHRTHDDYCKCPENQDHDDHNNCKFCGRCTGGMEKEI